MYLFLKFKVLKSQREKKPALLVQNFIVLVRNFIVVVHNFVVPVRNFIVAEHLAPLPQQWTCLMRLYAQYVGDWSEHYRSYRWPALGGNHRALGDAQAALAVLQRMAAPDQHWPEPTEMLLAELGIDPESFRQRQHAGQLAQPAPGGAPPNTP